MNISNTLCTSYFDIHGGNIVEHMQRPKIQKAADALAEFQVPFEVRVMSAHRTPHVVAEYAEAAVERGLKVIIAAAGGAAHLAGVVAAHTPLPVIGLPVRAYASALILNLGADFSSWYDLMRGGVARGEVQPSVERRGRGGKSG